MIKLILFGVILLIIIKRPDAIFSLLSTPDYNPKYPNGLETRDIKTLETNIKQLDNHVLILSYCADQIKKRTVIVKRDLFDSVYVEWKWYVRKLNIFANTLMKISDKHMETSENTKVVILQIIKDFTRSQNEQKGVFDGRIKFAIAHYEREYEELLENWRNLQGMYVNAKHNSSRLITDANIKVKEYSRLMEENNKDWSVTKKLVTYVIPALLIGGPSIITLGPFAGLTLSGIGPVATAFYHLMDTFQFKPESDKKYKEIMGNFESVGNALETIGSFISYNIASSTTMLSKIKKLKGDFALLSGDVIRDEFIETLLSSMTALEKYNNKIIDNHKSNIFLK